MPLTDDYSDSDFHKDTSTGFRWSLWVAVLLIALIILIAMMWTFGFGLFQRETAGFRGKTAQIERVQADPDYRIAAYESFYDKCASVQALEDQIAAMKADRSLPKDQRAINILALTNQRNILIREYNADARKQDTKANFLASDLPYSLDTTVEVTTCSA